jgi:hypothetical protein
MGMGSMEIAAHGNCRAWKSRRMEIAGYGNRGAPAPSLARPHAFA